MNEVWEVTREAAGVRLERLRAAAVGGPGPNADAWRIRNDLGQILPMRDGAEAVARFSLELRNAVRRAREAAEGAA